jgi:hypothetical protein
VYLEQVLFRLFAALAELLLAVREPRARLLEHAVRGAQVNHLFDC